jgi:hypothetical protein
MKMDAPKAPLSAVSVSRRTFRLEYKAAVSLPQAKALRAFSCKVVSPEAHEICLSDDT